uniref:Ig-like domain-containing protein n=1 Tax=Oryzias melastigma TaxID=30732 RepID=A0A3B3DJZ3_ORYME
MFQSNLNLIVFLTFLPFSLKITHKCIDTRFGEDVLLPCNADASFNQCADVLWSYKNSLYIEALNTGRKIEESSDKASRLSVKNDCSLIIRNITEKDAGQYVYKLTDRNKLGTFVNLDTVRYLNILSDLPGHNFILMVGSVVKVVLMFLGLVAALIYMYRRRTKENEEQRTRTSTLTLLLFTII